MTKFVLAFAVLSGVSAIANDGNHPCMAIAQACKAAGFEKGHHKEGKGLHMDCMHPIMEGKSVAGVSVDAATVKACQDKKSTWKENHQK